MEQIVIARKNIRAGLFTSALPRQQDVQCRGAMTLFTAQTHFPRPQGLVNPTLRDLDKRSLSPASEKSICIIAVQ